MDAGCIFLDLVCWCGCLCLARVALAALYLVNKQAALVDESGTKLVKVIPPCSVSIYVVDTSMLNWIHGTTETSEDADFILAGTEGLAKVVWVNTDLIETDGSVYLEASDPIHVYE